MNGWMHEQPENMPPATLCWERANDQHSASMTYTTILSRSTCKSHHNSVYGKTHALQLQLSLLLTFQQNLMHVGSISNINMIRQWVSKNYNHANSVKFIASTLQIYNINASSCCKQTSTFCAIVCARLAFKSLLPASIAASGLPAFRGRLLGFSFAVTVNTYTYAIKLPRSTQPSIPPG